MILPENLGNTEQICRMNFRVNIHSIKRKWFSVYLFHVLVYIVFSAIRINYFNLRYKANQKDEALEINTTSVIVEDLE